MLGFSIIILADFYRIRRQTKSFWGGHILKNSQKSFEQRLEQYFSDALELVSDRIIPDNGIPVSNNFFQPKQGKLKNKNSKENSKIPMIFYGTSTFAHWILGHKTLPYKLVLSKMRYFDLYFCYLIRILSYD